MDAKHTPGDLLGPLPEPEYRERVYVGHGNEEVCEWYTKEQMREREAAAIAACTKRCEELRSAFNKLILVRILAASLLAFAVAVILGAFRYGY